jgi:hypothetical protein
MPVMVTALALELLRKTGNGEAVEPRETVPNWTGLGNTVTGTAARAKVPVRARHTQTIVTRNFEFINVKPPQTRFPLGALGAEEVYNNFCG